MSGNVLDYIAKGVNSNYGESFSNGYNQGAKRRLAEQEQNALEAFRQQNLAQQAAENAATQDYRNRSLAADTDYHNRSLAIQGRVEAPADVREFQFARANGFKGSILDYQKAKGNSGGMFAGQGAETSGLNWLVANGQLTPEQAARYAASKLQSRPDGGLDLVGPGIMTGDPNAPAQAGVTPVRPSNPKPTEDNYKAAGFHDRAVDAEKVLSDPNVMKAASSYIQQGLNSVPVVGNSLVSEDYQAYDQAQRNMINAFLRRESGMAINPNEFKDAYKQYIPLPGDKDEKLKLKAENRAAQIRNLERSAGPAYSYNKGGGGGGSAVPGDAVKALQADPTLKEQFDAKYGQGAAARVLGGG